MTDTPIILTTLNARYIHASLGLRYLYANMGELQRKSKIIEFTIKQTVQQITRELLQHNPKIIGFGVYIWNTRQTETVARELKRIRPNIKIVIGGPEVSYEYEDQALFHLADHLITGQADLLFNRLCEALLQENKTPPKLIEAEPFALAQLRLPYHFYNDQDIAHRVIYVEASRGCPFKCEFCLSSLDKTAYPFNLDEFLSELDALYQRGARSFKFVDRTFNLKTATSTKILEFFLDRMTDDLFLHFELIPDNLPDALKRLVTRFPAGALQFEIGIQTFTPKVQTLISRKQNNDRARQNLCWLKQNTHAHLHTDLIFGLPGETLASFADSFNQLVALGPHEIQLGILKRLRGTPIIRHSESHSMVFSNTAPYEIISTRLIDSTTVKQITHFAKFWDKIANSGRFKHSLPVILCARPFENFLHLSEYLYQAFGRTHSIALENLFETVAACYSENSQLQSALSADMNRNFKKVTDNTKLHHNRRQTMHLQAH